MGKYKRYNIVYRLQKWMDSVAGQTFLNYAYSWGASVVIMGTLFKLTHLPSANLWLFLGMGTEVVVFFLSAFDRPFDKTADGMELAHGAGHETGQVSTGIGMEVDMGTEELRDTIAEINGKYRQHLERIRLQAESMDKVDDALRLQGEYAEKMGRLYARMIGALKAEG